MWAFVMTLMSRGCMMAAVPPGLTSVFQAGRMEDDMEVEVKGSFLARICLLEARGQDMLSRDCCIFLTDQKYGVCSPLSAQEAREWNIFSWAHCRPKQNQGLNREEGDMTSG